MDAQRTGRCPARPTAFHLEEIGPARRAPAQRLSLRWAPPISLPAQANKLFKVPTRVIKMLKVKLCTVATVAVLATSAASGMPMSSSLSLIQNDLSIQKIRVVCHKHGRCFNAQYRIQPVATPIYWRVQPRYFANYYFYDP